MSKNFELLSQAEKEIAISGERARPFSVAPGNLQAADGAADSVSREEIVKLVQATFLTPGPAAPRVVAFSGVERGDGCSWVVSRVAETMATSIQGTVCLVDANLRSPGLHDRFGVEANPGLADSVREAGPVTSFVRQIEGEGLWLMAAGAVAGDPHLLLKSQRLQTRMAELRAEFDYVLIDLPPVNLYADALTLGQLADGVILVLGANSTRREAARKAKETFAASGLKLLGAVLNKRTFPIPQGIYSRL
jgi:succinoglycan biosynthesis transport protein ExoP